MNERRIYQYFGGHFFFFSNDTAGGAIPNITGNSKKKNNKINKELEKGKGVIVRIFFINSCTCNLGGAHEY